jgi:anti-sigma factor RsiW
MYEGPSGERFTIYCARASAPASAFRYTAGDRAAAFYWADGKVAYVVSGPVDRERLEKVAKAAYEQMERDDAKRS